MYQVDTRKKIVLLFIDWLSIFIEQLSVFWVIFDDGDAKITMIIPVLTLTLQESNLLQ
jgi:hypothetical protein